MIIRPYGGRMIIRPYGSEKFYKPGFETFYDAVNIAKCKPTDAIDDTYQRSSRDAKMGSGGG